MSHRPAGRIQHQITPAAYQEMKIHDAPPPIALIALDAFDVKVIQEYRTANEAWEKARLAADVGRAGELWREDDMERVSQAHAVLGRAEMTLALLIDYLAKKAGV